MKYILNSKQSLLDRLRAVMRPSLGKLVRWHSSLPPRVRRLLPAAGVTLFITLAILAYLLLFYLTPVQRTALHYAKQLHALDKDLVRMEANIEAYEDPYDKRIKAFLSISTDLSDRCHDLGQYKPAINPKKIPEDLQVKLHKTSELCADVVQVSIYSNQIFDAVDAYVATPIEPTWTLPGAEPDTARERIGLLQNKASTALANIGQVLTIENEIRYAGVPEIQAVLRQNVASIEELSALLRKGDLDEADLRWKPALTELRKNQYDLLNHASAYWWNLVRLADLRQAEDKQRTEYCGYVPSRAGGDACSKPKD